eukprot:scaffold13882_cov63-Phaeocystis_antarctica.AAC.2
MASSRRASAGGGVVGAGHAAKLGGVTGPGAPAQRGFCAGLSGDSSSSSGRLSPPACTGAGAGIAFGGGRSDADTSTTGAASAADPSPSAAAAASEAARAAAAACRSRLCERTRVSSRNVWQDSDGTALTSSPQRRASHRLASWPTAWPRGRPSNPPASWRRSSLHSGAPPSRSNPLIRN